MARGANQPANDDRRDRAEALLVLAALAASAAALACVGAVAVRRAARAERAVPASTDASRRRRDVERRGAATLPTALLAGLSMAAIGLGTVVLLSSRLAPAAETVVGEAGHEHDGPAVNVPEVTPAAGFFGRDSGVRILEPPTAVGIRAPAPAVGSPAAMSPAGLTVGEVFAPARGLATPVGTPDSP